MKFDNSVDLPLCVDTAWDVLLDVPRIASCLPGAELTEIGNEHSFKGNVSIKLGPVALTFAGRAKIESIDAIAHRARIKAQGLDSKGRDGASSTVDFELTSHSKGSTACLERSCNRIAPWSEGAYCDAFAISIYRNDQNDYVWQRLYITCDRKFAKTQDRYNPRHNGFRTTYCRWPFLAAGFAVCRPLIMVRTI